VKGPQTDCFSSLFSLVRIGVYIIRTAPVLHCLKSSVISPHKLPHLTGKGLQSGPENWHTSFALL